MASSQIISADSTHWCRDSEVLNTSNGFVFCPSRDEILLRVSVGDILPVENLPVPGTCMRCGVVSGTSLTSIVFTIQKTLSPMPPALPWSILDQD